MKNQESTSDNSCSSSPMKKASSRRFSLTGWSNSNDTKDSQSNSARSTSERMLKLAMRMSLHHDSRLMQQVSRSMVSLGAHKHVAERYSFDISTKKDLPSSSFTDSFANSDRNSDLDGLSLQETSRTSTTCKATPVHALPPFPPLKFFPSNHVRKRSYGTSFDDYLNWKSRGLRPGLSVRVIRAEIIHSVPSITEYVVQVVDLYTNVFWIVKKRFHEFFLLRKKIRTLIREAQLEEEAEQDELKIILDLPFPRRRLRSPSKETISRRIEELEIFLRNVAAIEPTSSLHIAILKEFHLKMCSIEFISSLEKIDTTEEPVRPKWLVYDLFKNLNSCGTIEGHTCYKLLQAFRNRCLVIEAAVCPQCNSFGHPSIATDALKDLRNVVTNIQKYVIENLGKQYLYSMLNKKEGELENSDKNIDIQELINEKIYRAVEDTILVPLEQSVMFLVSKTINTELEERLSKNIESMKGKTQSEFGIPEHLQSEDNWGKSCHHLSMIDERQLPSDKIQELLRSALEIFKSCGEKNLQWRDDSALTADDYLPIHIYVVVHSGLKRPLMTKEYLGAMIHPSKMLGEVGYFLTMFEVALKYIADM